MIMMGTKIPLGIAVPADIAVKKNQITINTIIYPNLIVMSGFSNY